MEEYKVSGTVKLMGVKPTDWLLTVTAVGSAIKILMASAQKNVNPFRILKPSACVSSRKEPSLFLLPAFKIDGHALVD